MAPLKNESSASTAIEPDSREDVLARIADASISGYLGLFVGTGFSKAAAADAALSFEELLTRLAKRLKLPDFQSTPRYRFKSLPQIASQLLAEYQVATPPKEQATQRFKEAIARLCNVMPLADMKSRLASALAAVRPSWIITTNYDLILEALIEDAESVLPTAPLVPRPDRVPIYHIHGHRHSPASIMITEEDYVGLLGGPLDYQRLKLPLLLFESTTLMLGYALGDINVRAAMEWARSFRSNGERNRPLSQGTVVQALYKDAPSPEPYLGPHGEHVLELTSIADLLDEVASVRVERSIALMQAKAQIDTFLADPTNAIAVAVDAARRGSFLGIVRDALPIAQPTRVLEFLGRALDPIWDKACEDGGFEYYDVYLALLLDILEQLDYRRTNPALVAYLCEALNRVGLYIGDRDTLGMAWTASRRWREEHYRIGIDLKDELGSYASTHGRAGLLNILAIARK